MTINVPFYFPCLQKNARKLYQLIKTYCSAEDRAMLCHHLYQLRNFLCSAAEGSSGVPPDFDYANLYDGMDARRLKALSKRADSNYKLYCKMEVDTEWTN